MYVLAGDYGIYNEKLLFLYIFGYNLIAVV